MNKPVIEQLRQAREEEGLNQRQLADKVVINGRKGITKQEISVYEKGSRNTSLEMAEAIAKALNRHLKVEKN